MKPNIVKLIPVIVLFIAGCSTEMTTQEVDLLVTGNAHAQFDPCG